MHVKKQQLELGMEQQTVSKLRKECVKAEAEARKAPVASPRLAQTAPSWGGSLKQGKTGQGEPPAEQPRARNSARSGL